MRRRPGVFRDGYMRYSGEFVSDFVFRYENADASTIITEGRESILWANYDLMDWDAGTVLVAASDPVPVENAADPSGSAFPVVSITTIPDNTEPLTLTDDECAQLDAACAAGYPFIIRLEMLDGEFIMSEFPFMAAEPGNGLYVYFLPMYAQPSDAGSMYYQYLTLDNSGSDDGSWTITRGAMSHSAAA